MGYEPNPTAANPGRQQTHTIGVLAPYPTDTVIAMCDKETAAAGAGRPTAAGLDPPQRRELEHETGPVLLARCVARRVLYHRTERVLPDQPRAQAAAEVRADGDRRLGTYRFASRI
jgi:hypothetical protein